MTTRDYIFITGPETSTLPTAGTPTDPTDAVTLSYAQAHFVQGSQAVADIAALKAIGTSSRADKDLVFVESVLRVYHFDAQSSATGDDNFVVTPTSGTGRWLTDNPNANIEYITGKHQGSDPSTPASGYRMLYPKSDGWYEKDSNAVVTRLGSGSGSGELNVIANPSGSSNVTDWVASGSGVTVARTTTSSDLPLEGIINTAIKITPVSGTDYVYYRWTMPAALKNTKLKVQWNQRYLSSYATGDFKVEVYKNSASNYGGSYTEFDLSTDVSGTSSIPALHGRYTTTFDADTADYYELRIVRTAGTSALNITNVVVGPGIQPQGAVVGEWVSFTPTGAFTTNSTYTGFYRRVGSQMELLTQIKFAGAPNSVTCTFNLPSGFTIDTAKLVSEFANLNTGGLGYGVFHDESGGIDFPLIVRYQSTTAVVLSYTDDAATGVVTQNLTQAAPLTIANLDAIVIRWVVPIAEWSGNGVVNLAQNDVEYASTSGTWDAASTTTAYGPAGTAMTGALTASRAKTVTWITPITASDKVEVELAYTANPTMWFPASQLAPAQLSTAGTADTSAGVTITSGSATTTVVTFNRYLSIANDDSPTVDWGTSYQWRVRKVKAGQAVGFGLVADNSSGLMPSTNANLDNAAATRLGLKGYSHGTSYSGGVAPTITLTAGGGSLSSITSSYFIPYQLQDASWRLRFNFVAVVSSASRTTATFAVNGVTFKNAGNQAISAFDDSIDAISACRVTANTGNCVISHATGTSTGYSMSGDVALESKPTWAY